MRLRVVRADPAGNITLFVLDPVERAARPRVAELLMKREEFAAEQVGFACTAREGFDGRMEMAAGEFCGNAGRAYGMLLARQRGVTGKAHFTLEVSGADRPVDVDVDVAAGAARASMPLPESAEQLALPAAAGVLVDLGGIVHFVTRRAPDEAVLGELERALDARRAAGKFARMEAYGVIFLHEGRMTPLVKVPAAHSLFWEGSCGSGSLAAAVAESLGTADGAFARDYVQPAGAVRAEVTWKRGAAAAAYVGGSVALGETVEIEL